MKYWMTKMWQSISNMVICSLNVWNVLFWKYWELRWRLNVCMLNWGIHNLVTSQYIEVLQLCHEIHLPLFSLSCAKSSQNIHWNLQNWFITHSVVFGTIYRFVQYWFKDIKEMWKLGQWQSGGFRSLLFVIDILFF